MGDSGGIEGEPILGNRYEDGGKPLSDSDVKRIERLAKSLLIQNDKNKNGQLDKGEWSHLRGKPKESDRNKDGILTLDELKAYLGSYGSRVDVKKRSSKKRALRTPRRSAKSREPTQIGFRSPHERLPQGLPDWFMVQDMDRDGQLTMREYSGGRSGSKIKEFIGLDLNGDGVMTPAEYLTATRPPSS